MAAIRPTTLFDLDARRRRGRRPGAPAQALEGVAPAAAAEVEHPVPGAQPEAVEVDGQHGAARSSAAPRQLDGPAVLLGGASRSDLPGEALEGPLPAGRAERRPQLGVAESAGDGGGEGAGVAGRDEQAGPPSVPTTSGSAPPVVATSGTPQAIASTAGSEKPS